MPRRFPIDRCRSRYSSSLQTKAFLPSALCSCGRDTREVRTRNDKRCDTKRLPTTGGDRGRGDMILVSELCRNESCLLGKKTKQKHRCASHLRALCRVIGEEDCGHSVTTVVRVIRSVAPYTMICAQTRPPPLQTRPALVTRPERLTLKSRQDTFSDHIIGREKGML